MRAPHAADVTSLGVAMAAGWAHGVEVWDKDDQAIADVHGTTFEPVTNNEGIFYILKLMGLRAIPPPKDFFWNTEAVMY